jgi:hypothetical protein
MKHIYIYDISFYSGTYLRKCFVLIYVHVIILASY